MSTKINETTAEKQQKQTEEPAKDVTMENGVEKDKNTTLEGNSTTGAGTGTTKKKKNNMNVLDSYVKRVFKMLPDVEKNGMSIKKETVKIAGAMSMNLLHDIIGDMVELVRGVDRKTITPEDLQAIIVSRMDKDFANVALSEITKAMVQYSNSNGKDLVDKPKKKPGKKSQPGGGGGDKKKIEKPKKTKGKPKSKKSQKSKKND